MSPVYTYQQKENKSDAAASNSTGEGESCPRARTPPDAGLAGQRLLRRPRAATAARTPRYGWSGRVRRVGVSVSGT